MIVGIHPKLAKSRPQYTEMDIYKQPAKTKVVICDVPDLSKLGVAFADYGRINVFQILHLCTPTFIHIILWSMYSTTSNRPCVYYEKNTACSDLWLAAAFGYVLQLIQQQIACPGPSETRPRRGQEHVIPTPPPGQGVDCEPLDRLYLNLTVIRCPAKLYHLGNCGSRAYMSPPPIAHEVCNTDRILLPRDQRLAIRYSLQPNSSIPRL